MNKITQTAIRALFALLISSLLLVSLLSISFIPFLFYVFSPYNWREGASTEIYVVELLVISTYLFSNGLLIRKIMKERLSSVLVGIIFGILWTFVAFYFKYSFYPYFLIIPISVIGVFFGSKLLSKVKLK